MMERYALLWLTATVVLLVLVVWRGLLTTLALKVGIHYPPSALFAVALGIGAVLLVHFSLAISRLAAENKVLAQRVGLLQERLEAQEARARGTEIDAPPPGDLPPAPEADRPMATAHKR
jgi:Uncharacterized conserved protein (DUF2304)